ncbi:MULTISPECIES: 3-hydroxybutyrate dehydrogenase [Cryobacterium]|uniref:SDR family oxidoreductase n=1 Tax=Cryobacterium breve TaxID=1259258 RepID=A0ABY2J663_9MICO|nr:MULTISPECIES: 3-hydroxybutyrate dehydrogenase [Cryobacterium]TFC95144.1 SDR family oxidoreductase [Cryobacterium sp. TmT3-12]TFD00400.1 SDR family oxidoreductase [Cryobacterium breve]
MTDASVAASIAGWERPRPLSDRTALVTGGASGIGSAVVRSLAVRGAHVIVADVDGDSAAALAEEVGGSSWTVDLADTLALTDTVLREACAGVDILVNNAGIQRINPIQDFAPADFRLILALMLEAPFLLTRAVLPDMYAAGFGRVINVSSVHGIRASPFKSAYVAAKHGLEGLSKVTALEGGEHGVTSNCVSPGYVRTPLVEKQIADQAVVHGISESEVLSKIMLTESAIKRLVEPDEVGSLVAWLAGAEAAMVTGASYTMDGGWSAR